MNIINKLRDMLIIINKNPKVSLCRLSIAFDQKCYLVIYLSSLNLYRHTYTTTREDIDLLHLLDHIIKVRYSFKINRSIDLINKTIRKSK